MPRRGCPKHDSLSNMILQYGKYGKNHVYSHRKGKGMPSYDKLAENLQVGDLLVAKKRARPYHDVHRHAARFWLHGEERRSLRRIWITRW